MKAEEILDKIKINSEFINKRNYMDGITMALDNLTWVLLYAITLEKEKDK